jgi:hypothetical protein
MRKTLEYRMTVLERARRPNRSAVACIGPDEAPWCRTSSVIVDTDGRGAVGTPEVYCEQ